MRGPKGFNLSHQKVVLEVDFSGTIWGYTEITIVPTSDRLQTIFLNSRQCHISKVVVGGYQADYVHHDPIREMKLSKPEDIHTHPEFKRKLYSALAEGEDGELGISLPRQVKPQKVSAVSAERAALEMVTKDPNDFLPITIHIEYSLRDPADGVQFVLPNDAYPYRVPHAYTSPSSPDAARCWVPCVDTLFDRCTWDFEFVVPRYLEERLPDNNGDLPESIPTLVICSGDLVEQVAHPYNSNKTIFLFSQAVPSSVQHIAFAAGPFHTRLLPPDVASHEDGPSGGSQTLIHAFCLPGQENLLRSSVSILRSAMTFYTSEFGSYPFGSYKLVFVDALPIQRFDAATMTLMTVDFLHGDDSIEQVFATRHALSHALACQWVGINIIQKGWSDTWLINGLGLYITGLFLRKLFGNNEYRYRLKRDVDRIVDLDNGSMPPICQPGLPSPPDQSVSAFVNLKSPVVLHILDRRLGKSGTSLGLSRVLPKVFLSAISGEMINNGLSTQSFLKTCRKVSSVDLRAFAAQWIYGSGCPVFQFNATFNRKRMAVEITMHQRSSAFETLSAEGNEVLKALLCPIELFEGQMTIRIHEADGTPYEHVIDIKGAHKRYEVPFNTKYKRVRRNTKRYIARQAAAQAAADGDADAAEAMGMVDMAFGLEVWERSHERENWKVADWTEEDEQTMNGATYEWIRMDADFEWIANITFEQPDFMWVSQLQRDRDVVAQVEALRALSRRPTAIASSTFTRTVLVTNYFYRIRCEAALALVTCANKKCEFLGLFHMFKLFLRYCYDVENPTQDLFTHTYVPKPNNFSDLPEYYVRLALIDAISRVRFENGKSPTLVRQFFIDQLRYNDNTANPYSDAQYICALIAAASCATISTTPPERGELLNVDTDASQNAEDRALLIRTTSEISRYQNMDRLIPSAHNVVTVAALEYRLLIMMAGLVPVEPKVFFSLTREGHYDQVRIAAFDGLFMAKWYPAQIMEYVLAVMANDSSRAVRRHVARNAVHSLTLLASIGEMKTSAKDAESLLIEEDGTTETQAKEAKKSELDVIVRTMRKDKEVGRNESLRQFFMAMVFAPNVDYEVRWCLLKIADTLIRGQEEAPPKLTIHVPATPVIDTPLPSLIIRPPKASAATPITPVAHTPKIRLMPSMAGPRRDSSTPISAKPKVKFKAPKAFSRGDTPSQPSRGRAGGMSTFDLRVCRVAVKRLMKDKRAVIFLQPVDPIRDQAPNYYDVITRPMDISTLSLNLENGAYKDKEEFKADFDIMIANCKTYNAPGSFAHGEAVALDNKFAKQWAVVIETLAKHLESPAAQGSSAPTPPSTTLSIPATSAPAPPASRTATPTSASAPVKTGLKLKLGAPRAPTALSKATSLHKEPKKEQSTPPPPYIDDGSHDLLQEVIAIEKDRTSSNKRRRLDTPDEEEALLEAVAGESSSAPPGATRAESVSAPITNGHGSTQMPKITIKGKERAASINTAPVVEKDLDLSIPVEDKKCRDILRNLGKLPEAALFSRAVDPELDGCPTYFDEIKKPMDLGTMSGKLADGQYATMRDFADDMGLIFDNCRKFNSPGDWASGCADTVERAFKRELARAVEKKLSHNEKRSLISLVNQVIKDPLSFIFREPVDPVALGIPHYHNVIPQKDTRDLSTIKQKLETDQYKAIDELEADLLLMTSNSIKFNGIDTEVGNVTQILEARIRDLLDTTRTNWDRKRKEDNGTPQPKKKIKLTM